MGFFNGKFLFGADFNDEDFTRDGKPKKKGSSDDADNTQEIDMSAAAMDDEQKEQLMNRINSAENKSKKKSGNSAAEENNAPPAQVSSDADEIGDEEDVLDDLLSPDQARIVSIVLFALGILILMAPFPCPMHESEK